MKRIKVRHLWMTRIVDGKEVPVRRVFTDVAWKHLMPQVSPRDGKTYPKNGYVLDGSDPDLVPAEAKEALANQEDLTRQDTAKADQEKSNRRKKLANG